MELSMAEIDVYDYLKKHNGIWKSSKEIQIALGLSESSLYRNLTKVTKFNEIKRRKNGIKKEYCFVGI